MTDGLPIENESKFTQIPLQFIYKIKIPPANQFQKLTFKSQIESYTELSNASFPLHPAADNANLKIE